MFEFSNRRFLVVGSDFGSGGCLSWNCLEPITNNCAHHVSKVVYNKSAETGLPLAQPSLSLCKLLPLQSWWLIISCKNGAVAKYCHMELSVWLLPYQFFCLPWPLSLFHTHKSPITWEPTKYIRACIISSTRCAETSLILFTMVFQAFIVLL